MANFSPYDKINKENITVDFKQRVSPQKVILINRENAFYGSFFGKAILNDSELNNTRVSNSELSNVSLYDESGRRIDLSSVLKLEDRVYELESVSCMILFSEIDYLKNWCSDLSDKIDGIYESVEQNANRITEEIFNRENEDSDIRKNLKLSVDNLVNTDLTINTRIDNYVKQQAEKIQTLSSDIIDFTEKEKHYTLRLVSNSEDHYYLKEYAVNAINDQVPFSYLKIHDDYGMGFDGDIVGKIINLTKDNITNKILSFEVQIFEGCKCLALKPGKYHFDENTTHRPTGYYNYELYWTSSLEDEIQFSLAGAAPIKYYDVIYNEKAIAMVADFVKDDNNTHFISGDVVFNSDVVTEFQELADFAEKSFVFTEEKPSRIWEDEKLYAEYDKTNNRVVLKTQYSERWYHSLKNTNVLTNVEFGRIYEGDVEYVENLTISEVDVLLSAKINDVDVCKTYNLNNTNGFQQCIDEINSDYIYLENDIVTVDHREKYYQCPLSGFDESTSKIISRPKGYIKILNKNIDQLATKGVELSLVVECEQTDADKLFNGTYKFTQVQGSDSLYKAYGSIDDGDGVANSIEFSYDNKYDKSLIHFIYYGRKTIIGAFYIDNSRLNVYRDDSRDYFKSALIRQPNQKVEFNTLDIDKTKTFICDQFDLTKEPKIKELDKSWTLSDKNLRDATVKIYVPSNLYPSKSREFIVKFNLTKLEDRPVRVIINHDEVVGQQPNYHFFYNGKEVTNYFYIMGQYNTLRFTEIELNKFQIEDLNNTELNTRTENLLSDLTELSNYTVTEIEDIWKTIKGSLSFKDTLSIDLDFHKEIPTYHDLFLLNFYLKGYSTDTQKIEEMQLKEGFYYLATSHDKSKKYTFESHEIEYHDMIIVKENCHVSSVNDSKIVIFDSQDTDVFHLSANNQIIGGEDNHYLKRQIFENILVTDISAKNGTIVSLSVDDADVYDLSSHKIVVEDVSISSETVNDSTVYVLSALNISANNEFVDYLSVNNEVVVESTIDTANITTETVETIHINNSNVSSETVIDSNITNLSATNEYVIDEKAETLSVNNGTVVTANISTLNVDTENVKTLTADNATINDLTVLNSNLSNVSVVNGLSVDSNKLWFTDREKTYDSITNEISNKVEFLLSVDRENLVYKGTLLSADMRDYTSHAENNISLFFCDALGIQRTDSYFFKTGFLYSLSSTEEGITDGSGNSLSLYPYDMLLFNSDTFINDIKLSNFDVIRDARAEVESLKKYVDELCASLSTTITNDYFHRIGDNIISGNNEFHKTQTFDDISAISIKIDNATVTEETVSKSTITDAAITTATITTDTVTSSTIDTLNVKNNNVSSETVISSNITNLSVNNEYTLDEKVETLSVNIETVVNANISTLNVDTENVKTATVDEESVNCLTALNSELSNIKVNDTLSVDSNKLWFTDREKTYDSITNEISTKVEFLLSVDRENLVYKGTLLSVEMKDYTSHKENNISLFFKGALGDKYSDTYFFKTGFMYRLSSSAEGITDGTGSSLSVYCGDMMIVNSDSFINNIKLSNFDVVRDAKTEVEELKKYVDNISTAVSVINGKVDGNISAISTLSSDYHKFHDNTFMENPHGKRPGCEGISSEVLIVTDEFRTKEEIEGEEFHQQYYMTFLSGTLVLRPIQHS